MLLIRQRYPNLREVVAMESPPDSSGRSFPREQDLSSCVRSDERTTGCDVIEGPAWWKWRSGIGNRIKHANLFAERTRRPGLAAA